MESVDPLLDLKSWDGSPPICVICAICGSASALDRVGLSLADDRETDKGDKDPALCALCVLCGQLAFVLSRLGRGGRNG